MSGIPVVVTESGGLAVTAVDSGAPVATVSEHGGMAITLVDSGGLPMIVEGAGYDPTVLFAGGEQGAFYDPSDLSSMFQDSAGTTPAAVDSPVGRINDKSGRGNHAIQATADNRPILRSSGGLYWLELDTSGTDHLGVTWASAAQPWERVSAVRVLTFTNARRLFNAPSGLNLLVFMATGNILKIQSGLTTGPTVPFTASTDFVMTERHQGASSRIALNNGAYATADAGSVANIGQTIGSPANSAHFRYYGSVTIRRNLTDAEITDLRTYMADKAGVTL